ncbi:hypothetical protein MTR67_023631 [Solanum verrucosum]|uniref:Uncharacterized protein n=1 Tax=Solanum verrucosum TaxID=315347 RepID=A0AAF0TS08_SOLVR|nr:hypothetical protein MTR67_023631 [Solanum verrucosum]
MFQHECQRPSYMPIGTRSSLMKNHKGMVGIDSTSKVAYINGPIRPRYVCAVDCKCLKRTISFGESEDMVGLRVTHRGAQDMLLRPPILSSCLQHSYNRKYIARNTCKEE